MRGVAVGAFYLIAALIRRIKNRFGARKQRLVAYHVADLVPRMAHHTGRIDFRPGIYYLGRRDIVFIAAMAFGFAVAPFAVDAGQFVHASKFLVTETVVTCTAKYIRDKTLFLRGLFGDFLSGCYTYSQFLSHW